MIPGWSACYRCLFSSPPSEPSGPPAGPLGAVPGVIGSIQALEALKFILGIGVLLTNRLLTFDALSMTTRIVRAKRNPDCPLCRPPETG